MVPVSGKGISPLVATVLLIAATMSIAMILSFWASSFVKSGLPQPNQTQQQCQFSDFAIYQCSYSAGNKTLDIVLQNLRSNPMSGMTLQLFFTNNSVSQPYNLSAALAGGVYQSYRLNDIPSAFSKVIVSSGVCAGIVPDKEQACSTVA